MLQLPERNTWSICLRNLNAGNNATTNCALSSCLKAPGLLSESFKSLAGGRNGLLRMYCTSFQRPLFSPILRQGLFLRILLRFANRITYRGKDKEARRQAEQWPFASLQNKIAYKAALYYGVQAVKVDPSYTSQTCPVCGYVSRNNRPNHGEEFVCQNCGYKEHADIVGAINIAIRELSKTQSENLKGLLVSQPNAPDSVGGASSPPLGGE